MHISAGTFIITVDKERPGEQFDGLDMLTKLLAPTGASKASAPLIEVLGESQFSHQLAVFAVVFGEHTRSGALPHVENWRSSERNMIR